MHIKGIFAGSMLTVLVIASAGIAQSPDKAGVDVSIALKIAGQAYVFNGKGECTYAPVAGIYGARAQQWRVGGSNAQGSATLTFWRLATGSGDMFSLHAASGGNSYVVNTVRTSGGGKIEGSGKVTFTPAGPGGTFTIDATAVKGGTITGTMKCGAFSPAMAEGG